MTKTEIDLYAMLRDRYPLPKFSFATEVPDGTSSSKLRTIDAVAMGCWQTVGVQMIGHEIKHTRSDWQREMQLPNKCESWKRHCHLWYLVAAKGVCQLEELPASWGLMEPGGSGLKIRKPAERNPKPEPVGWSMLAAIMRKLQCNSIDENALRKRWDEGYRSGRETETTIQGQLVKRAERDLQDLQSRVRDFEKASGILIGGWRGDNVGKEFAAFQRFQESKFEAGHIAKKAESILSDAKILEAMIGKVRNLEEVNA